MEFSSYRYCAFRIIVCCTLFGFSTSSVSACEFSRNIWPNLLSFIYEPTAKRYWLKSADASDAGVKVQIAERSSIRSTIGSSKRLRIVAGYTLEIDQHRDLKSNATTLIVDSTKGLFNGSLSLSSDERVRQIGFTTFSAGAPKHLIHIYYENPRPVPDALSDMICVFENVPALYEEDE